MAKLTDREFVERAVVAGHISEPQGEECLDIARRGRDKGSHIPVAEVLVQRGYLTEAQARSVRYGGKVVTLQCSACGNQCRVRARSSTSGRQCPKCGGELLEDGAEADQPAPKPAQDADAPQPDVGAPETPATPHESAVDRAARSSPAEQPPMPSKGILSEVTVECAEFTDRCLDLCLSKWVLTLALTGAYTLLLRGLFRLIGVR